MDTNGYAKEHALDITVRADMLESVAGFGTTRFEQEYRFAIAAEDFNDPDNLRWIASLINRRVLELDHLEDQDDPDSPSVWIDPDDPYRA